MTPVVYDGSFEGFFSAVFEVYEYRIEKPMLQRGGAGTASLFSGSHVVCTSSQKAGRVLAKLQQLLSEGSLRQLYHCYLSELAQIDDVMFRYVQHALAAQSCIEKDYGHPDVLLVHQTSKKVYREKHRMEAFVRFQRTKDFLFYAVVQPDFNVLPLISRHFALRYADQRWVIYDSRRKYGIYYNLQGVTEVTINFTEQNHDAAAVYADDEALYQQLWKTYFNSVNIHARRNIKLHLQNVPRRYWRYLTEKQVL